MLVILVLEFVHCQGLNFHPRTIEEAHHLGRYVADQIRHIVVWFLHFKNCEVAWQKVGWLGSLSTEYPTMVFL